MVRGDELMDLLQLIVEFLVTHDHPYPQLPPTPVSKSSGISTQEVLTKMQEAYQKVLNKNIRIN
jgi:predicted RNase H-like HicB family nuclease